MLRLYTEILEDIKKRELDENEIIITSLNAINERLIDFNKPIYIIDLPEYKHTCNSNTRLALDYLRSEGYDVEQFIKLYNRHSLNFLDNVNEWMSCSDNVAFLEAFKKFVGLKNPRTIEKIGLISLSIDKSLSKIFEFLLRFIKLSSCFEYIAELNRRYNCEMACQYITTNRLDKNRYEVIFITKHFENFKSFKILDALYWTKGILSSIPTKRGLDYAKVYVDYYEHDIKEVLKTDYSYLNFLIEEKDKSIFIDGIKYAEKIYVGAEKVKQNLSLPAKIFNKFSGKYPDYKKIYSNTMPNNNQLGTSEYQGYHIAYKVTDNLFDNDGELVLKKGEIYNMPYTKFRIVIDSKSKVNKVNKKNPLMNVNIWNNHITKLREQVTELESLRKVAVEEAEAAIKAKKELEELNRQLDKKVQERTIELNTTLTFKSNLLTTTAHHTKTPLTLIRNGFDSLFTLYPELTKNRQLNMLKRNADLITRDIVNIFDVAQLEQGKRVIGELKCFNLSEMLKDKVKLFKDSARLKMINIRDNIEDELIVKADDLALNRVIDNLMDNGIKYCEKEDCITVSLKGNNSKVVLTVADDGPGIAKEELSHIFERYYQIGREKQVSSGLGLGLALTKEIVEELGGTIEVESEPGRGTTFRVELESSFPEELEKYELTKPVESSAIVVEELKKHRGGKNIMVVEDEPELLLYLRDALGEKYNIIPAANGREALEKLEECSPDLIISDIMMPGVDGLQLKESLPLEYSSTPFIFITAKTKESDKMEGLALGANDYICKPFNIEEVKIKVERFLHMDREIKKTALKIILDAANREFDSANGRKPTFEERCEEFNLTDREIEVVLAMKDSKKDTNAADLLFISPYTFNTHKKNIYRKVGVSCKKELLKKLF